MVVTLRGTVVPSELHFGYDLCRTREYRQAPMQCYKCYDFGHTKARCPAKTAELCRNCSEPHAIKKDEQGRTVCTAPAHCKNCDGSHSPTSRVCPKYREEEIIEDIRKKEDKSPREARRLFEERRSAATGDSYASVASNEKALAALRKELEAVQKENEVLRRKELDVAKKEDEARKALEKRLASYERKLNRARAEIEDLKAKEKEQECEEEEEDEDAEMDEENDEGEEEDEEENEEEDEEENEEEEEVEEEVEMVPCPEPSKRRRSGSSQESNGSSGKTGNSPNANKNNDKTINKTNNNTINKNTDKTSDWQKVPGKQNKRGKR